MFTLKNLLLTYHGMINRIQLSYQVSDCPTDVGAEYDKWFSETNKDFKVDMDLQHTSQKLEKFKQLMPYLDLEITCWGLFNQDGENVLYVDLQKRI
jgi:hypothetical protein